MCAEIKYLESNVSFFTEEIQEELCKKSFHSFQFQLKRNLIFVQMSVSVLILHSLK